MSSLTGGEVLICASQGTRRAGEERSGVCGRERTGRVSGKEAGKIRNVIV